MTFLCDVMEVNRSENYKWVSRKGTINHYDKKRISLTHMLTKKHAAHKFLGYHRLESLLGTILNLYIIFSCKIKLIKFYNIAGLLGPVFYF